MNGHFMVVISAAVALFGAALAIDAMQPETEPLAAEDCVAGAGEPTGLAEDACAPADAESLVEADPKETDPICPVERGEVQAVVFEPAKEDLVAGGSVAVRYEWDGACADAAFFLASYERTSSGALRLYEFEERDATPGAASYALGPISLPECAFTVLVAIGPVPEGGEVADREVVRTVEAGTDPCQTEMTSPGPSPTSSENPDPAPSPTPSDAPAPSPSPSPSPSETPSGSPSPTPSETPSESPSPSPSPSPSESPSESPSPSPTESPSPSPSESPSPSPTESPSPSPSESPSPSPSESPSPSPTESPSESPVEEPSPSPSPTSSGNDTA